MNRYTLKGSTELEAKIAADLRHIAGAASPFCSAGILLGGYGRGEGTPFIHPDGSQSPFNDYDLVVIIDKPTKAVRQKIKALEKQLTDEIGLPVDLYPYPRAHLPLCEFSLLNYEMKNGHMVLWGDKNILAAMPAYDPAAIPLSEGTRLLLNRGKLLLDIKRRLATPRPLTEEERVRFIKFIHKVLLAFGDAALLAAGQYDVSYAVKKTRIQNVGTCPDRDFVMAGYLSAIGLKEWGDFQSLHDYDIEQEFSRAINIYLRFMPWYRSQCSNRECSIPKAVALNLKWNKNVNTRHPREALYEAIVDLLQDKKSMSHERFYTLQRRFS